MQKRSGTGSSTDLAPPTDPGKVSGDMQLDDTTEPRPWGAQERTKTMKPQRKLLAVFTLIGLATVPAFGQMPGMSGGGKMPGKSASAKATTKQMAMCCMGGMDMGKGMSGMSAADKKKIGKCCMAGMKAAGMKPSGKGMGDAKKPGAMKMGGDG